MKLKISKFNWQYTIILTAMAVCLMGLFGCEKDCPINHDNSYELMTKKVVLKIIGYNEKPVEINLDDYDHFRLEFYCSYGQLYDPSDFKESYLYTKYDDFYLLNKDKTNFFEIVITLFSKLYRDYTWNNLWFMGYIGNSLSLYTQYELFYDNKGNLLLPDTLTFLSHTHND